MHNLSRCAQRIAEKCVTSQTILSAYVQYLQGLNPPQLEAATSLDGPLMIIAGAGSGKTRVLTMRLAFILDQGLANPYEILALTFTNKAAKEMKERIEKIVGKDAHNIQMGTFHSVFSRILRVEAERLGFTRAFTIYDDDDSKGLIKDIVKEKGLDDKIYKPSVIYNAISSAKNQLTTPEDYRNFAPDEFNRLIADMYGIYQTRMLKANAMDFGDLLMKAYDLFQKNVDILNKYQQRFKYLMVDEYQDTNHAQYMLVKMIAAVRENVCVVGDDAQSIYAFRGANIDNILNFQKDYPDAKIVKLEQNYRSTNNIVQAANSVIAKNKDQIQKNVFTDNEIGDLIFVQEAATEQEEAKRIADMIREQKQTQNFFNKEFAILYRTNAQSRSLEDALRRAGLKYRIYGGTSFYKRKEIKDAVAYLRLAINPSDEQAVERVLNYPKRGIGDTTIARLKVFASERQLSFWEALKICEEAGIGSRPVHIMKEFVVLIESFGVLARNKDAYEAANKIIKDSGILKALHAENDVESMSRWENVQELLNGAKEFVENPREPIAKENAPIGDTAPTLENFLSEIALFSDADSKEEEDDVVTLMTIHSAKGLEFKSVFIAGLEMGIFPSHMVNSQREFEEERRLFYVAITRAEKRLTLSYAKSRYKFGQLNFNEPSPFLSEIAPEFLRTPNGAAIRDVASMIPSLGAVAPPRRTASAQTAFGSSNMEFSDLSRLAAGNGVIHPKFGKGTVKKIEGKGDERKATVVFDESGDKVLVLKYAKMKIVG